MFAELSLGEGTGDVACVSSAAEDCTGMESTCIKPLRVERDFNSDSLLLPLGESLIVLDFVGLFSLVLGDK